MKPKTFKTIRLIAAYVIAVLFIIVIVKTIEEANKDVNQFDSVGNYYLD